MIPRRFVVLVIFSHLNDKTAGDHGCGGGGSAGIGTRVAAELRRWILLRERPGRTRPVDDGGTTRARVAASPPQPAPLGQRGARARPGPAPRAAGGTAPADRTRDSGNGRMPGRRP